MRFLDKYELLEPVSGGPVETFTARDLKTGQRLIVHLFSVPDMPLLDLNVERAVELFSRIAPAPLEPVVAGGRYEQTSHAYLITEIPAEASDLQGWITSYHANMRSTAVPEGLPNSEDKAQLKGVNLMGDFTRAFLSAATADLDIKEGAERSDGWSSRPAGPFSKEFLSGFEPAPADPGTVPKAPIVNREAVSFTAEFLVGRAPQAPPAPSPERVNFLSFQSATEPPGEASSRHSGTTSGAVRSSPEGEFTDFFSGPFANEKERGEPLALGHLDGAPSPRRQEVGEFTRIFGPGLAPSKNPDSILVESGRTPAPEPLTGKLEMLGEVQPRPELGPAPTIDPNPAWNKEINWEGGPAISSATEPQAPTPTPSIDPQKVRPHTLFSSPLVRAKGAATEVFKSPGESSQPMPSRVPGPSEYTRVISVQPAPPVPKGGVLSVSPQASPAPLALPAVAAPPIPSTAPPKVPQVQLPPITTPKLETPASPKIVAYLPLIVVMNALLLLAVALVLYFALKH